MQVVCEENKDDSSKMQFVRIHDLNTPKKIDVANLLMEAEYAGKSGVSGLFKPITASDVAQVLNPYSKYANVLVNDRDVMGFVVATTKTQISDVSDNVIEHFKNDPEFNSCIDFYKAESGHADLILHDIAIEASYRSQGYFKLFLKHLYAMALANGCNRILFVVRESNPALDIYKYYGAKVIGEVECTDAAPSEKFLKCCLAV